MNRDFTLSDREVADYFDSGFVGPYTLREDMTDIRAHVVELLASEGPYGRAELDPMILDGHPDGAQSLDRHLDCRLIANLCTDNRITDRLATLYGDDLLLLYSQFMNKRPSGDEVGWHQDKGFFGLHPPITPNVWVAIDEATERNGCLQLVPGSNKWDIDHIRTAREDNVFEYEADPEFVEDNISQGDITTMELEAGEFVIFSESTLHRSLPNQTHNRRLGLSVRATLPYARFPENPIRGSPKLASLCGDNLPQVHRTEALPQECRH